MVTGGIPYEHQKKGIYYRVIDEYSLFYFNWIEPIKETLLTKSLRKGYWQKMQKSPTWYNWMEYAFEAICYKHLDQISQRRSILIILIRNTLLQRLSGNGFPLYHSINRL